MNFTQFLLILKARAWVALLALGVTVATTLVVSLLLPKQYTATTTLVVDAKAKEPVTGALLPAQLLPGYLATQVDILTSQNVALKVVNGLKLADNPQVKADFMAATEGKGSIQNWLGELLIKNLEIEPSRESSVIRINFKGTDPQFAAIVSNAFAQAYIHTNLELKVEPARQTSAWYETKIKSLRTSLEEAQSKLSAYQRQHGLFASDERLDVETSRLAELSSQLVAAQSSTYDSASKQKQSGESLPDVMNSPVVQTLRADLARAEGKLSDLAERVGKNHPQYQSAKAEVDTLRAKLNNEISTATKGVSTTAKVAMEREGDLRASLSAQKSKVLQLKKQRDDLTVLLRDVENAQRAYDTALQRYHQTSLEAENTQTDVSILNPAVPPIEPSSPKIMLNTILAVFLGGLLGIGLAFLMEMIDRRVRSGEDVAAALGIPVLGELGRNRAKRRGLLSATRFKAAGAQA
ncbi:MAG: chain length determinant protein EpsF [Thiobacillaceae bacterium]|jgi:chain length determinant protein EpsF|nr:chain length determinant protein EpsF [Thiobacillaceae bacterium]